MVTRLLQRRRFIVDPALQLSMVTTAGLFAAFILTVMVLGLFLPLATELSPSNVPDPLTMADNAAVMVYLHSQFWWIAVASVGLGMLGAVYVSHRIAGPLVRFKRHLRMLGQGTLPPPLRTRPNDYLKAEVAVLNQAAEGLGRIFADVRAGHAALAAALAQCRERVEAGADREPRVAMDQVMAAARRLDAALACIRPAQASDSGVDETAPVAAALVTVGPSP